MGGGEGGVNNPCFLLHIYHQLYKKPQETRSFFRQLSRAAGNPRTGSP